MSEKRSVSLLRRESAALVLSLALSLLLLCACGGGNYAQGENSREAFGDGEYQLLCYTDRDASEKLELHNCDLNHSILKDIRSWEVEGDLVRFLGKCPIYLFRNFDLRGVLDTRDNSVILYYNPQDASAEMVAKIEQDLARYLPDKAITVEADRPANWETAEITVVNEIDPETVIKAFTMIQKPFQELRDEYDTTPGSWLSPAAQPLLAEPVGSGASAVCILFADLSDSAPKATVLITLQHGQNGYRGGYIFQEIQVPPVVDIIGGEFCG